MLNQIDRKTIIEIRKSLEYLYKKLPNYYLRVFIKGEKVRSSSIDFQPLLDTGLIEKSNNYFFSKYSIYPIKNCFILTDQFSNRNLDRVFPISDDESGFLARKLIVKENEIGIDIGTGSGIYAVVAAQKAKKIFAIDINLKVIEYVRFNALLNGVEDKVEFILGDTYDDLTNEKFDFIVSDPPVVPTPRNANFWLHSNGGPEGTNVLGKIFDGLASHIKKGTRLQMVSLSLENGASPTIINFINKHFRKLKYKIELTELYGGPLKNLDPLCKIFESERYFEEWKALFKKKEYNQLHYFYLFAKPSNKYSLRFHVAQIGNWKSRLKRLSPT